MEDVEGKRPRPRRSFTPEFKAEIVECCRRGDRSVLQVARDFDLTETAVREWVKQAERDAGIRPDGLSSSTPSAGLSAAVVPARHLRAYSAIQLFSRAEAVGRQERRAHLHLQGLHRRHLDHAGPAKDVKLLASEIDSIHGTWPGSKIVLLGHSGGGLVVGQYWQNYAYQQRNVRLAVSTEGPINSVLHAGQCTPHCPGAFGFGAKVLNFLGKEWNDQASNDAAIIARDTDGSFVAISTEGDSAYGFLENGLMTP